MWSSTPPVRIENGNSTAQYPPGQWSESYQDLAESRSRQETRSLRACSEACYPHRKRESTRAISISDTSARLQLAQHSVQTFGESGGWGRITEL